MKISLGLDHGALSLRQPLLDYLEKSGHTVIDHGTRTADSVDYPDYARKVGDDVASGAAEVGILCCTTGIGMSMAANRIAGVRAALVHHQDEAALSRQHNKANVICFGAIHLSGEEACGLVDTFLQSTFEGGRHERRVSKFSCWEGGSCV